MRNYQQCVNCILDSNDDPNIEFDEKGVCNYCRNYIERYVINGLTEEQKEVTLNEYLQRIKKSGKGKKYDSIMGLSGGVDSSFLAYKAKELGLRPLIVHFDSGWNSELAVQNIESIINKTGFDLFTYVVDWEEFRDLQLAYIRASVIDWDIPIDHGFLAMLYHQAARHKIKYIIIGYNHQTESILPRTMRWSKMDVDNILDIHRQYGTTPLKTFPLISFLRLNYYLLIKRIKLIRLLEYVDYNKTAAMDVIKREFGWRNYKGKHYESIFTRFYQGYVLVEKFGYDKRKAHLSNLILSGQITRDEALREISTPSYDPEQLEEDKEYVIKKLGLTLEEFQTIMSEPPRSHLEFKSYETGLYRKHEKFMIKIRPLTRLIKKILPV